MKVSPVSIEKRGEPLGAIGASREDPAVAPPCLNTNVDSWEVLIRRLPVYTYPPRVEILRQGFTAENVYVIQTGLVKLVHSVPDGRAAIVGLRQRPNLLGAGAALLDDRQPLTAVTLTECMLHRVPCREFARILREGGEFSWHVHLEHCRELQREMAQSAGYANLSARERLEQFLISVAEDVSSGNECALPIRDWELAQLLAITPPYMSRLMHEQQEQGRLVRRGSRWLYVGGRPGTSD